MKPIEWRRQAKLTQTEAAKLIGCTQPAYSNYERGAVVPPAETVIRWYAASTGSVTPMDFYELPPEADNDNSAPQTSQPDGDPVMSG